MSLTLISTTIFLIELLDELNKTLRIDNETFLVFDVSNVQVQLREEKGLEQIQTLVSFYGNPSKRNILGKHYSSFKAKIMNQCQAWTNCTSLANQMCLDAQNL